MMRSPIHRGDCVRLENGDLGRVVSAADDGSVQIKTDNSIIVSSLLDDDELETGEQGGVAQRAR